MHDLKSLRDDPTAFDRAMARRGLPPTSAGILALDETRRAAQTELQSLQARRNEASREIGRFKREGSDADHLMDEVARIKDRMTALEEEVRRTGEALQARLAELPNLLDADVPDGPDESANVERHRHGTPARPNHAREHDAVGATLGMMDFEAAARMSGARFVVLKAGLASLSRALGQFMLDLHVREHGYLEVQPPLLVRDEALFGTGQLPKFAEDQFRTTTGHWLIPTAEVPLTNLVAGRIVDAEDLPLRFTALTPCFRSEAGAAGRDTRGMIRQHQFDKVELVSATSAEGSADEHERMLACAEEVLKRLGLAYRVMILSSGDTGFGAARTYDIEVWLPGQKAYREISSCSNTRAFQARRMDARYRPRGSREAPRFVHTLNGSGVAVGRALIAVLETFSEPDGSVTVPDCLRTYMGGTARIEPIAAKGQ